MSAVIEMHGVGKRFGAARALDGVSLTIRENEFYALLGPSGCGKTTLLRVLAGFETPDEGAISLDGKDLIVIRPNRRPINMMFQSYALFPHLSVFNNIAYGLRMDGVRGSDLEERTRDALAMVQLDGLESRRPHQLSGGQRQRVALARALVKRPRVLLLDEPLAALDKKLRGQMQIELKRLQHVVGITFVVVTHDQEEALVMADRIALMREGRIVQEGTPKELYEQPASYFVADFIGDMNFFAGTCCAEGLRLATGTTLRGPVASGEDSQAWLAVRPDKLALSAAAAREYRGQCPRGRGRRHFLRRRLSEHPSPGPGDRRVDSGEGGYRRSERRANRARANTVVPLASVVVAHPAARVIVRGARE